MTRGLAATDREHLPSGQRLARSPAPGHVSPRRRPQSGPRDTWRHPALPRPAHLTAHGRPRPAPWRPPPRQPPLRARRRRRPEVAPSCWLRAGGRRRPLQGLTKPDGALRRYLYAEHVVMETHQLKPAAIGSGREARAREGPRAPRRPTPDRVCLGAGGAGRARQWGGAPRVPAHPRPRGVWGETSARAPRPARPRAGHALRQARARAPSHESGLPACRRALWAAGGSRPEHAQAHLVDCSPSTVSPPTPHGRIQAWKTSKILSRFCLLRVVFPSGTGGLADGWAVSWMQPM